MPEPQAINFDLLYQGFQSPISELDCGKKCSPYNQKGVPFCCDTRHAVPTAYEAEWDFLRKNTDLWHIWRADDPREQNKLQSQTTAGQVLIECKGHLLCQRKYRAITCRAFPFFPYINKEGKFLGVSYYWEYEDRCWVISHLEKISKEYIAEFYRTYQVIFQVKPAEKTAFRYHSAMMRQIFGRKHRAIPLIQPDGSFYKITPRNGRQRRVYSQHLPKFNPYRLADQLPFPDENS